MMRRQDGRTGVASVSVQIVDGLIAVQICESPDIFIEGIPCDEIDEDE